MIITMRQYISSIKKEIINCGIVGIVQLNLGIVLSAILPRSSLIEKEASTVLCCISDMKRDSVVCMLLIKKKKIHHSNLKSIQHSRHKQKGNIVM